MKSAWPLILLLCSAASHAQVDHNSGYIPHCISSRAPSLRLVSVAKVGQPETALPPSDAGSEREAAQTSSDPAPVVTADFSNPALTPSHWVLTLHRDGSGHFHSDGGDLHQTEPKEINAPDVDRDFHVSAAFADQVFLAARENKWFNIQCESHLKIAFQGWRTLAYRGPEGRGACTYNYSKDRDIQSLGESIAGVAETLLEGARLETLLQHDRLGLDREMEYLTDAVKDGRMREIGAIQEILARLEADPEVLDRVRKRARALLAHPAS